VAPALIPKKESVGGVSCTAFPNKVGGVSCTTFPNEAPPKEIRWGRKLYNLSQQSWGRKLYMYNLSQQSWGRKLYNLSQRSSMGA